MDIDLMRILFLIFITILADFVDQNKEHLENRK